MEPVQPSGASQLFTVRLWAEPLGDGRTEWRGQVCHVMSGRVRYFREWPALLAFLEQTAREAGAANRSDVTRQGEQL